MGSPEGMWNGMLAEPRKTWRSSALPRRVMYDGRPLNAADGAIEAVWGASPIPAAQPVALFARPDQEFSC